MHEYRSLPRAREDGLLEEAVGEELLLYDQESHTAHCLSPIAACVWRHCDGEHDLADLAQFVGASEDLVADALHELCEKDLLDAEPQFVQSAVSGISRREAIGRAARYGAAAAAGSLIVSATAATPAMAASTEYFAELTEAEKKEAPNTWRIKSRPEGLTIHTVTPEPGPNKVIGASCVGKTTPCNMTFEYPPVITNLKVT